MYVQYCEDSIKFFRPLQRIANFLGLEPPLHFIKKKKHWLFYTYFCKIAIVLLILAFGFSIRGRSNDYYFNYTEIFLDVLSQVLLLILTVFAIYKSFSNMAIEVVALEKNFGKLNHFILRDNKTEVQKRTDKFYVQLFASHVVILGLIIYDVTSSMLTSGLWIVLYYAVREVTLYCVFIIVMLIYNYASFLKCSLKVLNQKLLGLKGEALTEKNNLEKIINTAEWVRKQHFRITKAVEIMNHLYGWQIFLLILTILVEVLRCIEVIILIIGSTYHFYSSSSSSEKIQITIESILWSAECLTMGVAIAVVCDSTTKEAQHTPTICYNLLLEVPAVDSSKQERILKKELILLAQQATHQCPHFSAAGFFNVDCSMLFALLGTVTSYVVVLIQISK